MVPVSSAHWVDRQHDVGELGGLGQHQVADGEEVEVGQPPR